MTPSGLYTDWQQWLLLAAPVLGALALLYLLRPRRRRVEVPFGGLWQRVLQESEARVLGKQWRRILSFVLLAALAGLLLASLAEPMFTKAPVAVDARAVPHTVIVVDTSASMASASGASTRLQEAILAVEKLVDAAPAPARFLLLAASSHTRVLSGWGAERPALKEALRRLQPTSAGLDLQRAHEAAGQALAGRAQPRIVLVSDGGRPQVAFDVPAQPPLQHVWVGPARPAAEAAQKRGAASPSATAGELLPSGLANLAVEQVRVRPDAGDPSRGTLTVRVRNDGRGAVAAQLLIAGSGTAQTVGDFERDEALRRLHELDLPPGSSSHDIPGLDLSAPRIGVRVRPRPVSDGTLANDVAAYDDWGFAVLAERKEIRVLLVGPRNLFLEASLHASDRIRVGARDGAEGVLPASAYDATRFSAVDRGRHGIDVVILNQVDLPLPDGTPGLVLQLPAPATLTAATPGAKPLPPVQYAEAPELAVRAGDHPLMRGVSFQDANFDKVRVLRPQPGDTVLAIARPSSPVMVARQQGVRRVEWGLDLDETDLGGRYAMPILVDNAIAWLVGEDEPLVTPIEPGRPWAVEAPVSGLRWTYHEPGQLPRPARVSGTQLLGASEAHGIHVWRADDGREVARPTALPATEQPGDVGARGEPWRPLPPILRSGERLAALPAWALLLLVAAAALALEWGLYLRRRTL